MVNWTAVVAEYLGLSTHARPDGSQFKYDIVGKYEA